MAEQDSQDLAGQDTEGLLALAGRLPLLCAHQGVSHAAEGGTQFLPLVRFLSFSLEGLWRVREVLFLSFSLEGCWSKYPDSGLELPVYIGLKIYWTPGLFGTANFHWSASHLHSGKAGTLPSAWLIWGRWSQGAAGSLSLELLECLDLLRADWPSAHLE